MRRSDLTGLSRLNPWARHLRDDQAFAVRVNQTVASVENAIQNARNRMGTVPIDMDVVRIKQDLELGLSNLGLLKPAIRKRLPK